MKLQARRLATEAVHDKFLEYKRDPELKDYPDDLLYNLAREVVRSTLTSKQAQRTFDEASDEVRLADRRARLPYQVVPDEHPGDPERGKEDFRHELGVFLDPAKHLASDRPDEQTNKFEDYLLSKLAFRNLVASGSNTPNAWHIQDHLNALQDPGVAKALSDMELSEARLVRNVLLHDLGKEYGQLPTDFRAFLEQVFPKPQDGGPDRNFVPRVIMSHEFGSMMMAAKLAKEAGIPERKIPRLKALFAHHNAGYDPDLPGDHFWVRPNSWAAFASTMQAHGLPVPNVYAPVLSVEKGGDPETIVLTAIDRATSLTLASQEKFAPVLVSRGSWNNEALAEQFKESAVNVIAEVHNILGKLDPARRKKLQPALDAFYHSDRARLTNLAAKIPQMAKGAGVYSDRPATTQEELNSSIVYRKSDGDWFRVTSDGKVYEGTPERTWKPREDLSTKPGERVDPPGLLFRKILFSDQGYEPSRLVEPRALKQFPR